MKNKTLLNILPKKKCQIKVKAVECPLIVDVQIEIEETMRKDREDKKESKGKNEKKEIKVKKMKYIKLQG